MRQARFKFDGHSNSRTAHTQHCIIRILINLLVPGSTHADTPRHLRHLCQTASGIIAMVNLCLRSLHSAALYRTLLISMFLRTFDHHNSCARECERTENKGYLENDTQRKHNFEDLSCRIWAIVDVFPWNCLITRLYCNTVGRSLHALALPHQTTTILWNLLFIQNACSAGLIFLSKALFNSEFMSTVREAKEPIVACEFLLQSNTLFVVLWGWTTHLSALQYYRTPVTILSWCRHFWCSLFMLVLIFK